MSKLVVKMSITLDGFVCGPRGEMDWMLKSMSPDGAAWLAEKIGRAGAHLLGRKAFEELGRYWPNASGVFVKPMNEIPKIVFSKTGFDPSKKIDAAAANARTWAEARVVSGDLAAEIAELKNGDGKPLVAHGGASFAQSLVETGLVDEFWLVRHPVAIGQGKGLFDRLTRPLDLALIEAKSFSTGTVAEWYRRP